MKRIHPTMTPVRLASAALATLVALASPNAQDARGAPGSIGDIARLGALGDGTTVNTAAIQGAIDACSARGGGTLVFPAGRYLTGTIQLKDGVTLRLGEGATLLGSTRAADYRNVDPFTDGTGAARGYALVCAVGAKNVGIEGPGTLDGQGAALKAAQSPYSVRPFLIRFVRCTDVAVRQTRLRNSGAWALHCLQSSHATFSGITLSSRGLSNNDGIDVDSSEDVRIEDCDIDTGDDAVCLKTTGMQPCRNISVTHCRLSSNCAAIKLGTESLGDFETIRISDCRIRDTRLGGIKILSVDGADLHDLVISDITMERVTVPIMLRLGARLKSFRPGDRPRTVGRLHDIAIRRVRATESQQIGILISGVPGHPLEDISLEDIAIDLAGGGRAADATVSLPENEAAYPEIRMFGPIMPAYGMVARHIRGLHLDHVRLTAARPDARPASLVIDGDDPAPGA